MAKPGIPLALQDRIDLALRDPGRQRQRPHALEPTASLEIRQVPRQVTMNLPNGLIVPLASTDDARLLLGLLGPTSQARSSSAPRTRARPTGCTQGAGTFTVSPASIEQVGRRSVQCRCQRGESLEPHRDTTPKNSMECATRAPRPRGEDREVLTPAPEPCAYLLREGLAQIHRRTARAAAPRHHRRHTRRRSLSATTAAIQPLVITTIDTHTSIHRITHGDPRRQLPPFDTLACEPTLQQDGHQVVATRRNNARVMKSRSSKTRGSSHGTCPSII